MRHYLFLLPFCLAGLTMSGCTAVGIATGVGATAGVAAVQEGGLSRATRDAVIQAEINDLWFRYNLEMFRKLDMTVNNGRVLLTGIVQNPEHRVEAVRLAWQPEGVEQVINEINVAGSQGITGFARDTWITGRLRTALIFEREVQSVNYSIDTVGRVVYLMGFAQSQYELSRVIEIARTLSDVQQVVSYVKIVGDQSITDRDVPPQRAFQAPVEEPGDGLKNGLGDDMGRIDWNKVPAPPNAAPVETRDPSQPIVILPEPPGYPNVQGREPVIESEDLVR